MTVTVARTLDCKGLSCPLPILRTAQAVRTLAAGDLIEVLATDPGSVKDFAAWSKVTGNEIVESDQAGGVFRFLLKKKG